MKKIKRAVACAAALLLAGYSVNVSLCVAEAADRSVLQIASKSGSVMGNIMQSETWDNGRKSSLSQESLDGCDDLPVLEGGVDINVDNNTTPREPDVTTDNDTLKDKIEEGIHYKPSKNEQDNSGQTTNPSRPQGSGTTDNSQTQGSGTTDDSQLGGSGTTVTPNPPTNPAHGTDPEKNQPTVPEKDSTSDSGGTQTNPGSPTTKPDSSEETPVQPGSSEETPVQPGSSGETPVNPGNSEGTIPVNPGSSSETPVKPGSSEGTIPVKSDSSDETPVPGDSKDVSVKPGSSDGVMNNVNDQQPVNTEKKNILKVSAEKLTANDSGKLTADYVTVFTDTSGGFTAAAEESWIKIGTDGGKTWKDSVSISDSSRIYISTDKYSGSVPRRGTITVTHRKSGESREIVVVQNPCKELLDVDRLDKIADPDGSFFNNTVAVRTLGTGSFTVEVEDSAGWLAISTQEMKQFGDGVSKLSFKGDGVFYLAATANDGENRTAKITVTHGSGGLQEGIMVTQLGYKNMNESKELLVNREFVDFQESEAAFSKMICVWTDADVLWAASTEDKWIQIVPSTSAKEGNYAMEGKGTQKFYIRVTENYSSKTRYGFVKIWSEGADGAESIEIAVGQAGVDVDKRVLVDQMSVQAAHKTLEKGKTTKIRFFYPDGLYVSDIAKVTYTSSKAKVASVSKQGVIKGKKEGTAVIYVKVCLEDGYSKQMRLKVTIGKRRVENAEAS